jgi:uncharacterized membrane protein YkoI
MIFRPVLPAFVAFLACGSALGVEAARPPLACLNPADAREALTRNKFTDPAAALRSAAAVAHADPLRSRLCRWNDDYVYEITLLRRDGKVMRVVIKADDGSLVTARSNP